MLGFTQNNLVFNRVLNFEIPIGGSVTVPSGKAWKVESVNYPPLLTTTNTPYGSDMNNSGLSNNGIFWISEGTIISPNGLITKLSILEFNLVPTSSGSGSSSGSSSGVSADGFAAIGIVDIEFNDSEVGIVNHLMGTITVPEGEIWKITNVEQLRSPEAFGSRQGGNGNILTISAFIGYHQFSIYGSPASVNTSRYLTEGSYQVRSYEAGGIQGTTGNPMWYRVIINGIKYSSN